jgi:hypothetical protein
MSDKYIIRNCNVLYFNPDKTAICNDLMIECPCYCQDRTDCVWKQVVGKCKKTVKIFSAESGTQPYAAGRCTEAEGILQLLDIQECE